MDLDIGHWLEIFKHNPVLIVLVAGLLAGTFVTQAIKYTYLSLSPGKVSNARYSVGVWWLAILLSAAFTKWFWIALLPTEFNLHGLGNVVSITAGFGSPCLYWLAKRLLSWWKPDLAAKLGDNESHGE